MLIAGSGSRVALLDAADEPAKFGDLLVTPPDKDNEGCDKKYENRAGGQQVFKSAGKGSAVVPRDCNVGDRQQTKQKIRQPPQLTLAPFKLGEPIVEVGAWRIKGSSQGLRILPVKLGHSGGCVLCGVLQNPPLCLLFSRLAAHPAKRRIAARSRRVPARPTMFKMLPAVLRAAEKPCTGRIQSARALRRDQGENGIRGTVTCSPLPHHQDVRVR